MDFKQQIKKEFIPAIQEMIQKESTHLAYMMDARDRMRARSGAFMHSPLHAEYEMDLMIGRSSISLNHLRSRLQEYTEYANKP